MSEIQRELISLKVKYYHEETPKLEEVESEKDEKQKNSTGNEARNY